MHWLGQQGVRLSQPQGYVQIDWSNPITRGLLLAVSGQNILFDSVNNAALINSGLINSPGSYGKGVSTGTVAGTGILSLPNTDRYRLVGTPCTIFHLGQVSPTDGGIHTIWSVRDASTQVSQLTVDVAGGGLNFVRSGVGGSALSMSAETARGKTFFALAADSSSFDLYSDGQSSTQAGGLFTASSIRPALYNRNSGGRGWAGKAYLTLMYERKFTAQEIASLAANPWQIFLPTSSIWFPVNVTGGSNYFQSLSSSIVLSGVISKSIDKQTTAVLIVEGSQKKDTAKSAFNGVVQAASVLSEGSNLAYNATGSITPSGLVNSSATFVRNYLSQITLNGGLVRSISKLLTGSISLTGFAFKGLFKFISGSISISGILNSFKFTPTPGGLINRGMRFMRRFIGRR